MLKKLNWFDLYLLLVVTALIGLFVFAQSKSKNHTISHIDVKFLSNNNHFITQEMVNNLLIQNFPRTSKVVKEDLDLNKLEHELQKNQMIASSQVYVEVNGTLHADVVQKTAIARVLRGGDSFYVDSKGDTMSLSNHFSAHVPVVTGDLLPKNKERFTEILNNIYHDAFLKTSVTGIKINADQTLDLNVRDYNYNVEFGRMTEVERKFNNYKAFVHYMQKDSLMDYYTNINLRFTEQVICTK